MSKNNNQQLNNISTLKQLKEAAGLFTCMLEHKVVKTTAQFKWTGPKIPPEEWHKVCAFFEWSYKETRSETQVRAYVNQRLGTWKFWAYPQEANTGMSARELDNDEAKKQREQFSHTDGWLYFNTTHHHCSGGAFQSSTDETNEKNQDGLHITVGNMGEKKYSLHERFYISGIKIPHQLDWFWDIGDALNEVPDWAKRLLPEDISDRLARGGMIQPPPEGIEFPKEWKDNLIYRKPEVLPVHYTGGLGYTPGEYSAAVTRPIFQRKVTNMPFDLNIALEQFKDMCKKDNVDELMMVEWMHTLLTDPQAVEIIAIMYRNDVSLDRFVEKIEDWLTEPEKEEQAPTVHEKTTDQLNGIPDYHGNLPE